MIRIPSEEVAKIKKSLEQEGFLCKKERELPSYGLYSYTCDFDTKGEQKSSLSVSWMRNKLVQNKAPHLIPTREFEYTYVESMIVVPRKTDIDCPNPIDISDTKIKYLHPHDSPVSCFHSYSGENVPLVDIEKFIRKIPKDR